MMRRTKLEADSKAFRRTGETPPWLRLGTIVTSPLTGRKYRVNRLLSRGGYGSVYQAAARIDGETRKVCIKITADLDSWHQEVHWYRVFAKDPRVVELLDAFPLASRRKIPAYIMVLEYAEEGSLSEYLLESGPLAPLPALRETVGLLRTLERFHDIGGIHRDITPDNILVCRRGDELLLKFTDFGIARQRLERNEVVEADAWNPGWVPSEVARDRHFVIQSDLYQLALVLWTMLTGSETRLMDKRELDRLPEPEGLKDVLHQALNSEPRDRYLDAGAMRADLEALLDYADTLDPIDMELPIVAAGGPPVSLEEQVIVIAGKLAYLSRMEATVLAVHAGAQVRTRITSATTLVVIGAATASQNKTTQAAFRTLEQVDRLNELGAGIRLISESEFLHLAKSTFGPQNPAKIVGTGRKPKNRAAAAR